MRIPEKRGSPFRSRAFAPVVFAVFCAAASLASAQEAVPTAEARFRIVGLTAKTQIWVDGQAIQTPDSDFVTLPVGEHRLYLWEDDCQPMIDHEITVRADGTSFAVFLRYKSHEILAKESSGWALGTGIAGATISIGGPLIFLAFSAGLDDFDAQSRTFSTYWDYAQYDKERAVYTNGMFFSALATVVGVGLDIFAVSSAIRSGTETSKQKAALASKPR